jgi:hypothetical protein
MPPAPFVLVFRWFWGVALVVMLVNGLVYRARLRRLEAAGGITAAESGRLLRILGLGLAALILGLWAIQLDAGWPSPLCMYARPLADPHVQAALAVTAAEWVALLAWIFAFGGAQLVSRASPGLGRAFPGSAWSPGVVKGFAVLVVAASMAGLAMAMLNPSPLVCEVPPPAAPRE